ncbi:TetR/AcrR family transcriptional regulator [Streptomyces fildesensis]|uniref:TetR/AcrR family transcriptional regulator n=1 Tax=Streptomyces fildesensis TaxID=375757 RepID=UPI0018E009B2|nr:TetR/AcrR family transcriptional regulator [Streptomyces fildesensis]
MPKLWTETMDAHRAAVRTAILDAAASLVSERGLASVNMSQIAAQAGIGRATLYKYFPDVGAVLLAWHEQQIRAHLDHLAAVRDHHHEPQARLEAVLHAYAALLHERHHGELAALAHSGDVSTLHRSEHLGHAQQHLTGLIADLIAQAAQAGDLRDDVAPQELAQYCLHALGAAADLPSKAAAVRLADVTLAGLRNPH